MKTIKVLPAVMIFAFVLQTNYASAQIRKNESQVIIQTSAQCEKCKYRIEEALSFEAGIKKSDLDLKTKKITVNYNPSKITPEKIRIAISKVGYDADEVKADPKAYEKLPPCCKKPDNPNAKAYK